MARIRGEEGKGPCRPLDPNSPRVERLCDANSLVGGCPPGRDSRWISNVLNLLPLSPHTSALPPNQLFTLYAAYPAERNLRWSADDSRRRKHFICCASSRSWLVAPGTASAVAVQPAGPSCSTPEHSHAQSLDLFSSFPSPPSQTRRRNLHLRLDSPVYRP